MFCLGTLGPGIHLNTIAEQILPLIPRSLPVPPLPTCHPVRQQHKNMAKPKALTWHFTIRQDFLLLYHRYRYHKTHLEVPVHVATDLICLVGMNETLSDRWF